MPGKTLRDAIMEELSTPEHEKLYDTAERFQQAVEEAQARNEKQPDNGLPSR